MNGLTLLQSGVLLVLGAAITFAATWLAERRSARRDATIRATEHAREDALRRESEVREDALRAEERAREDDRQRWERGHDHALEAIRLLRSMQDEMRAAGGGVREIYQFASARTDAVREQIGLVPDADLRENADLCISLLSETEAYWPPNWQGWSGPGMIVLMAIQNLTEFARGEPTDQMWLKSMHDVTEEWWHTGPFQ
jgi:hypothetical protein